MSKTEEIERLRWLYEDRQATLDKTAKALGEANNEVHAMAAALEECIDTLNAVLARCGFR